MKPSLSNQRSSRNDPYWAYCGLIFVIVMWGISPMVTLHFYQYYSPTIRSAYNALAGAAALLILSRRKLGQLNSSYFRVAIPTGIFYTAANILQKIGLQYTTPTHYSFLENLSCIIVPVLLFIFIRKKPTFLTILSSVLCLVSSFVLIGPNVNSGSASALGDTLCALAGLFYGVNIAATGAFTKKMSAPLYLMILIFTESVLSFLAALVFHAAGIEPIRFDLDWRILLANTVFVLFSSTLCWLIRTSAMKHVDATVVAVMMPFSSVVTTVLSVAAGEDMLTPNLLIGAALGLTAIIMSGFGDRPGRRQKIPPLNSQTGH